jgi:hypothetical protein
MDELKTLERTKKSAVQQVSGNFNPLTAGSDKSEARKLLGLGKTDETETSFWQSTGFLVGSLVVILGVIVFAVIPASPEKNLRRAEKLMASDRPNDWLEARDYLDKIKNRGPDHPLFARAEALYFESRRRTLVQQAEHGRVFSRQSLNAQKFIESVQHQQEDSLADAAIGFYKLTSTLDPEGEERHIHQESSARLKHIEDQLGLPAAPDQLLMIITQQKSLSNPDDVQAARSLLNRIIELFTAKEGYRDIVNEAQAVLQSFDKPGADQQGGQTRRVNEWVFAANLTHSLALLACMLPDVDYFCGSVNLKRRLAAAN